MSDDKHSQKEDAAAYAKKVEAPKGDTSKKLYRVQVGAYSVKANAEAMAKKLKADGYDAVIV